MSAFLTLGVAILAIVPGPTAPATPPASPAPSPMAATLYLVPDTAAAAVGGRLPLQLQRGGVGAGANRPAVPWASTPTSWFFIRTAGTQENRDSPVIAAPADGPPARAAEEPVTVPITRSGVFMVGLEAQPGIETVDAASWQAFMAEALDPAAADAISASLPPEAPVRIRRVESAKAVIRVGAQDEIVDAQTASSKAGQTSEIRLLQDATALLIGSDVQLRAYTDHASRGGVRVRAACDTCDQVQVFTVDRYGIGLLHLTDPGRWRIEAHHAHRLPEGGEADVVLYTASLSFEAVGPRKEGE